MIGYLLSLMEEGKFQQCLKATEQQLIRGGMDLAELATVNMVVCRCRVGLQDPVHAIPSGLLAAELAREIGEWDILGRALLSLGTALIAASQFDRALNHLYSYFEHLPHYRTAARFEGSIWRSIGIAHQRKLEFHRAISAFERARTWFSKRAVEHAVFTCAHDLINTYLQFYQDSGEPVLEQVPRLLKTEKEIANKYLSESYYRATYLQDLAAFFCDHGRYSRAFICALHALDLRQGDHEHNFHCQMVLHQCNRNQGAAKEALEHAVAARLEAIRGRQYELEMVAAQAISDTISEAGGQVAGWLDEDYQQDGVGIKHDLKTTALLGGNRHMISSKW